MTTPQPTKTCEQLLHDFANSATKEEIKTVIEQIDHTVKNAYLVSVSFEFYENLIKPVPVVPT